VVIRRAIALTLLTVSFGCLFPAAARAADALPWFHTYTVPGNYAVGGVDLVPLNFGNGVRTRRIVMGNQVPANAKSLAAYLLWETMWSGVDPAVDDTDLAQLRGLVTFRGQPVTGIKSSTLPLSFQCRGIGNGQWISMMKADVLRLLPKQLDQNNEWTGRYLVNDDCFVTSRAANGDVVEWDPHGMT
jgi:hypothetical protein